MVLSEALAATSTRLRSVSGTDGITSFFECEADLHCNLPVADFTILDISAGLGHFKPTHVADGLLGACQRIFYGLLESIRRGTNHLNFLVNMLSHARIISRENSQRQ